MRIHYRNIGILIFGVIILFMLLKHGSAISRVVGNIERIGPEHSTDEMTSGLFALGFICVSLVAIVKLLIQNKSSGRGGRRRGWVGDQED